MIDERHLSGDLSFKLTKCVVTNGAKPFTATYCIMNEFTQVSMWWFTTGSGMAELDGYVQKIKQRYNLLGFDGLQSVSTDWCCHERKFWECALSLTGEEIDTQVISASDLTEVDVVKPPFKAEMATSKGAALILVGKISDHLCKVPCKQRCLIVDGEWTVGRMKMELLIICQLDYKVYLFHLAGICRGGK